jgi:hypothetical protein
MPAVTSDQALRIHSQQPRLSRNPPTTQSTQLQDGAGRIAATLLPVTASTLNGLIVATAVAAGEATRTSLSGGLSDVS